MLDKFEIAEALREISLLLELKKENPYKARAYAVGATAVEAVNEDIGRIIEDGRLTTLRGIGDTLARQIVDLYEEGNSALLQRLRKEMPPGVIELSQVPGLSVKKIQALHDELEINTIDELEQACREGRVQSVRGFGEKTEQNLLAGIQAYRNREQKELLLHARETLKQVLRHLEHSRAIKRVEPAGAIRRWQEVVDEVKVVAVTADNSAAIERMKKFPLVSRTESESENSCVVRLGSGMKVHLVCACDKTFAAVWLVETGAPAHVEHLQRIAAQRRISLQHGSGELLRGGKPLPAESEADIYESLGLAYIPPELREDWGEIEAAFAGENFDDLVRVDNIKGMVHCHSQYSDGKDTIEDMALAAEAMGMDYITITDHSPLAGYAGGLDVDRLKRQWEEIARVQEKTRVKILRGTESDILEDGALDYPDEILEQFDVIVASIHSRLKMDVDQMTNRLINCMRKPQFKIWGHALGRLLLRREPLACRLDEVLEAVAESRAAIEVNGDPYRLDMQPELLRKARRLGIRFVVSVDAHSTGALNYVRFGVEMARRGGLRRDEVLNTLPVQEFMQAVKP
ncbi:MAG TPA: PHP domain-containing protein [Candidatus Obscuribacterales bacterium]